MRASLRGRREEEELEMSDEEKVSTEQTAAAAAPAQKPKRSHWPIVISVLAIIVIAGLVGFLHLHELPRFCSTMCHTTMAKYVDGYYSGDESMEVTVHEEAGVTCLGCHWTQAKMMDLLHEVQLYVTDSFTDPLTDHRYDFVNDEFCGACHDGTTAQTKEEATADWVINPHAIPEGVAAHEGQDFRCGSCHSVHKSSTMVCAKCHDTMVEVPEGWLTPEDSLNVMGVHDNAVPFDQCASCHDGTIAPTPESATAEKYGVFDMHAGDTYVQFSTMHETAGADGGVITCSDCHENRVIACGQCHANTFSADLPDGWSIPENAIDVVELMSAAADDSDSSDSDAEATDDSSSDSSDGVTAEGVADGTYTATGTGIGGDFDVTVTVEGGQITSVEVGENSETQGIGSNAIAQLPDEIVAANGTVGVDGVAGASITSAAIFSAVADALDQGR